MSYIADLELCRYHPVALDADRWCAPLLAIGWLEFPQLFPAGVVPPAFVPKLRELVAQTRKQYSQISFRGMMHCSMCKAMEGISPGPIWSQENIFVPGDGVVYVAPGGIIHYVEAHSYLPPSGFIEAVMRCGEPGSEEYCAALRHANNGNEPPLQTAEEFWTRFHADLRI